MPVFLPIFFFPFWITYIKHTDMSLAWSLRTLWTREFLFFGCGDLGRWTHENQIEAGSGFDCSDAPLWMRKRRS